jgi:hypothetical protein
MKDQMHVACGTYRRRREMYIGSFRGKKIKTVTRKTKE